MNFFFLLPVITPNLQESLRQLSAWISLASWSPCLFSRGGGCLSSVLPPRAGTHSGCGAVQQRAHPQRGKMSKGKSQEEKNGTGWGLLVGKVKSFFFAGCTVCGLHRAEGQRGKERCSRWCFGSAVRGTADTMQGTYVHGHQAGPTHLDPLQGLK